MVIRYGTLSFPRQGTVIEVPAILGGIGRAAAGKLGHAPLKRNNGGQAIAPRFSSALASRGREGSPHHASQSFAPGSIRVAGDSGSAPATTNAAERPNPIERFRTIDA